MNIQIATLTTVGLVRLQTVQLCSQRVARHVAKHFFICLWGNKSCLLNIQIPEPELECEESTINLTQKLNQI
jgi:hypothetical protein